MQKPTCYPPIGNPILNVPIKDIQKKFVLAKWPIDGELSLMRQHSLVLRPIRVTCNHPKITVNRVRVGLYSVIWVLLYGSYPKGEVFLEGKKLLWYQLRCEIEPPFTPDISNLLTRD